MTDKDEQIQREKDDIPRAAAKFRQEFDQSTEHSAVGRKYTLEKIDKLAIAIKDHQQQLGEKLPKEDTRNFLLIIEPDCLALIILRAVIGEFVLIKALESLEALTQKESECQEHSDDPDAEISFEVHPKLTNLAETLGVSISLRP